MTIDRDLFDLIINKNAQIIMDCEGELETKILIEKNDHGAWILIFRATICDLKNYIFFKRKKEIFYLSCFINLDDVDPMLGKIFFDRYATLEQKINYPYMAV